MRFPLAVVAASSSMDCVRALFVKVTQSVVLVVVEVVVVVVVLSQTPPVPQTCEQQSKLLPQPWSPPGMQETHSPVVKSHSDMAQVPHEPPQPSLLQFLPAQFGVQQAPLTSLAPGAQQRPNRAVAFFVMAFAQFRLQQLCGVAQT